MTRFATLRWTKSSPGASPTIWFAGTRLSEQPIQRYCGACCRASSRKNSGFTCRIPSDQARLFSKRCSSVSIEKSADYADFTDNKTPIRAFLSSAVGFLLSTFYFQQFGRERKQPEAR